MIVGAQKSGTTSLYDMLCTHPNLHGSRPKEPHFFSKSPDWRARLDEYRAIFPNEADGLRFEASTTYTFFPHFNLGVWDAIHAFNPGTKIIYLVREPVARIVSAYRHLYERGYTDRPFEQALSESPTLINVTRYATQITPYIERFGRENVHIGFFEDLVRDPCAFVRDVADFVGVDPDGFGPLEAIHSNKSGGEAKPLHRFDRLTLRQRAIRKLAPAVWRRITDNSTRTLAEKPHVSETQRSMIRHLLRAEIDELEEITGRRLDDWRGGPRAQLQGAHVGTA